MTYNVNTKIWFCANEIVLTDVRMDVRQDATNHNDAIKMG
jgi:hypothetical protein